MAGLKGSESVREGDFSLAVGDMKVICESIYKDFATCRSDPEVHKDCIDTLKGWQKLLKSARDSGRMPSHPSRMELELFIRTLQVKGVRKGALLQRTDRILRSDPAYRRMKKDFYASVGGNLSNDMISLYKLKELVKRKRPTAVKELEREVILMAKSNPKTAQMIEEAQRKARNTVTPSRVNVLLKIIDGYISKINREHRQTVSVNERKSEKNQNMQSRYAKKYGKYMKNE